MALFLVDGFLHFRVYRSGGGNPPPADAETGKMSVTFLDIRDDRSLMIIAN